MSRLVESVQTKKSIGIFGDGRVVTKPYENCRFRVIKEKIDYYMHTPVLRYARGCSIHVGLEHARYLDYCRTAKEIRIMHLGTWEAPNGQTQRLLTYQVYQVLRMMC